MKLNRSRLEVPSDGMKVSARQIQPIFEAHIQSRFKLLQKLQSYFTLSNVKATTQKISII